VGGATAEWMIPGANRREQRRRTPGFALAHPSPRDFSGTDGGFAFRRSCRCGIAIPKKSASAPSGATVKSRPCVAECPTERFAMGVVLYHSEVTASLL
jgi:hypothetical protein